MPATNTPLSLDSLDLKESVPVQASQDFLDNYGFTRASFQELLEAAGKRVLSMGVGDTTSQIGALVAQLFVAKMFFIQGKLGFPQEATVIQPPDATIQTSAHKFLRSVPEAAMIRWGDPGRYPQFIPAEIDIDFCGMITVGLKIPLDAISLAENIFSMQKRLRDLGGLPLDTNCIQPGNHFANVYQVVDHEAFSLPPYVGVAHIASDEYRDRLRMLVEEIAVPMATPFGTSLAVTDAAAQTYWETAQEGAAFATCKRRIIAQEIFRSDWLISDDGHYKLTTPASCVIGCNQVTDPDVYHILVSKASDPAYLVQGTGKASVDPLREKGILPGDPLFHEARDASILPHGSGHTLIEDSELATLRLTDAGRIFVTRLKNGAVRAVHDYHAVPMQSRRSILVETLRWGLVRPGFVTLRPLCSVKV